MGLAKEEYQKKIEERKKDEELQKEIEEMRRKHQEKENE